MKKKQKRSLFEIVVAVALFAVCAGLDLAHVLPEESLWRLLVYLVPYGWIGWRVAWKAVRNICHGQVFDENFLMTLATVGALCTGEYPEAVFVMLFYRVGELFEQLAVGKSRDSIAALMRIRPDVAHVERDGVLCDLAPEEVTVGDVVVIRPGERIPLDGVIVEGSSALNTMALTGESLPREVAAGDSVISGCINEQGVLRVRVNCVYEDSTVARILKLVEESGEHKSKSEHFITKFARYYTPAVVGAAVLLAVVPPLFLGVGEWTVWREWIMRSMTFLVISCPCALVISVPLSFFGGIGGASRKGILIKGSNYMEALAACDTVAFDKTGTLTEGVFAVTNVSPTNEFDKDTVLRTAAAAEAHSTHPLAAAIRASVDGQPLPQVQGVQELAGYGVRAELDGKTVCVGNRRLMAEMAADWDESDGCDRAVSTVYVSIDGRYAGCIELSDRIKSDAKEAMATLRGCGVRRTVMLTGDSGAVAEGVARKLGITEWRAELLPDGKVEHVKALLAEPDRRGKLAFVGDGINDAPVLALSDVGIAMGMMGSDAAMEAADVVLMDDRPAKIAEAIKLCRRTIRIVRQNIVLALAVKAAVLVLGALGLANLWLAVFADVGVAVLAILNAMRTLK